MELGAGMVGGAMRGCLLYYIWGRRRGAPIYVCHGVRRHWEVQLNLYYDVLTRGGGSIIRVLGRSEALRKAITRIL